jgi:hypothetical protein
LWIDVEDGGSWWEMLEPVAETTEEELNLFFSCLVFKTSDLTLSDRWF